MKRLFNQGVAIDMKLIRPRLKWLAVVSVLMIAVWLLASFAVAYRFTHRGRPIHAEPSPSTIWGRIESLRLETSDRERLGAWYLEGEDDKPVVLFLHGNGGCRSNCLGVAEMLVSAGYSVLMVSHRAHGDSTGELNDFGYSARHDVLAAVSWLKANKPQKDIVIWGQSLGSAAAIFAAKELDGQISGYIFECPYQDLYTAVWNRTKAYLPPVFDVVAYAGLLTVSPLILPEVDAISPLNSIEDISHSAAVLILAGGSDSRARPEEAAALANRLGSRANLVVFPGAEHLQLAETDPRKYRETILDFLAQLLANPQ